MTIIEHKRKPTPLPVKQMIGNFQCPGCSANCAGAMNGGGDIRQQEGMIWTCFNHSAGTFGAGIGKFMLGLPKGFNRTGLNANSMQPDVQHRMLRFWTQDNRPPEDFWDHLNVPVWAMEYEGHLLVRTYSPRINVTWIDVVEGGSLEMVPGAINVAEFIDDID